MPRIYTGNIPADGRLIGERDGWKMYERPPAKGFRNFKLVSNEPSMIKANFHIGWNVAKKRIANTRDAGALLEYLPALHAWVTQEAKKCLT